MHLSKYPKAIQSKREKDRQIMKRKDLGSSQSSGDIIEKLLRIIKEQRHHFHNKIWVALILKLLKLQKLPIQKPLLSPKNTRKQKWPNKSRTEQNGKTNPNTTKSKQTHLKIIHKFQHFLFLTSRNKDFVQSTHCLCI